MNFMGITFRIAFRNLVRQKRRNLLLGTGIAFSIIVLYISQSYTRGFSDILINSFISGIFGHIQLNVVEKTERSVSIIRDKAQIIETVNNSVDNAKHFNESVSTLTRAVGNNSGALLLIVGIERDNSALFDAMKIIDGDLNAFKTSTEVPPLVLYAPKAEELNVRAGEYVSVKMSTIYGQMQSARMFVTAVAEPKNIFLNMAGFTAVEDLKALLGYRPHETARLNIVLEHVSDPQETVDTADRLQEAFCPKPIAFKMTVSKSESETDATAFGLNRTDQARRFFQKELGLPEIAIERFFSHRTNVFIGSSIAEKTGAEPGSRITISYPSKYDGIYSPETRYRVAAIIRQSAPQYSETILFNGPDLFHLYTIKKPDEKNVVTLPESLRTLSESIIFDRRLMDRPQNSKDWKALQRSVAKTKEKGSHMYITSMNETAEDVLNIESVLNLISFITVSVLFSIILTGAVNALRMTIRERTREIGTVRSIGMQKKQVVGIFVTESALLAFFAATAGILLSFMIMGLLSRISFEADNLFSMLLNKGHLYFYPEAKTAAADIILAVLLTIITAWFPARKAAAMPVTKALRHYE